MRRILYSLMFLSFSGAMFGCHCVTGVCDCDPQQDNQCCHRYPYAATPPVMVAPGAPANGAVPPVPPVPPAPTSAAPAPAPLPIINSNR